MELALREACEFVSDDRQEMATTRKKKTASRRHRNAPDPLAAGVGKRVRALRMERSIGFDALVTTSGLGRGYISELERGLVVPTVGTLARIAAALDVTIADLVIGTTDRERVFEALRTAPRETLAKVIKLATRGVS